jgi:hypothetical protein
MAYQDFVATLRVLVFLPANLLDKKVSTGLTFRDRSGNMECTLETSLGVVGTVKSREGHGNFGFFHGVVPRICLWSRVI